MNKSKTKSLAAHFESKEDEMMSSLEPTPEAEQLAEAILEAYGKTPEEMGVYIRPTKREDGKTILYIPKTRDEYELLANSPYEVLEKVGMQRWGFFRPKNGEDSPTKLDLTPLDEMEEGEIKVFKPGAFKKIDAPEIKWIPIDACDDVDNTKSVDEILSAYEESIYELWLFPGEWYEHIPEGTTIVSIMGKERPFNREKESNDLSFGALAYGFLKPYQIQEEQELDDA